MIAGLKSNETKCDGTTQQSLPAAGKDCCITLLVSLLFKPVTTEQHPYIQLVSVVYIPASSIPTSLSFKPQLADELGYLKIV